MIVSNMHCSFQRFLSPCRNWYICSSVASWWTPSPSSRSQSQRRQRGGRRSRLWIWSRRGAGRSPEKGKSRKRGTWQGFKVFQEMWRCPFIFFWNHLGKKPVRKRGKSVPGLTLTTSYSQSCGGPRQIAPAKEHSKIKHKESNRSKKLPPSILKIS